MIEKTETGNVVKEIIIGNTKVKICDDYCRDRILEEIENILKSIAENYVTNIRL